MGKKVSVIIPAYNAQKRIGATLDSLLAQSIADIEILVVDDCSTDSTRDIITEYSKKDSRIIPIFCEVNGGPAAARNRAIEKACGEFITFADADDTLEPDMLEQLYCSANGADITVTGFFHDTQDKDGNTLVSIENRTEKNALFTQKEDIVRLAAELDSKRLFAFPWNKLYRTDFMKSVGASFPAQTLCEDFLMNCSVWDSASAIALVDGCYYHYVKSSDEALTQRYREDYFDIMDSRFAAIRNLMERNGLYGGKIRCELCKMHIKHLVAGMTKLFNPKAGLKARARRAIIKEVLKRDSCREAVGYAKSGKKQEVACNAVVKSRSAVLCHLFASLLYKMQTGKSNLFDKLK